MCTFEQQTVYQVLSGGIEVILEVDGQSKVTFTPRTEQPFLYFWQTATIQGFDTLLGETLWRGKRRGTGVVALQYRSTLVGVDAVRDDTSERWKSKKVGRLIACLVGR